MNGTNLCISALLMFEQRSGVWGETTWAGVGIQRAAFLLSSVTPQTLTCI